MSEKIEEAKKILEPEEIKKSRLTFESNFKKKKILCIAWLLGKNGTKDKFVGSTKRKIGKTDFVIKGKRYFINYDFLKEGKKYYEYHCDVRYANVPVMHKDIAEDTARLVIATQADTMLMDGVVRVLMGKGGIPALYLLIAFIVVAIAMAGAMYIFGQYQSVSSNLEKQKTASANMADQLQQLKDSGITIPPSRVVTK